jgi:hypothetical protein
MKEMHDLIAKPLTLWRIMHYFILAAMLRIRSALPCEFHAFHYPGGKHGPYWGAKSEPQPVFSEKLHSSGLGALFADLLGKQHPRADDQFGKLSAQNTVLMKI